MKIGCALLAAGAGVRFGGNKLTHAIDGEPMIARALRLYAEIPFTARVCVTRSEAREIQHLAQAGGYGVVINPDPGRGIGSSVAVATVELIRRKPELDGILYAVSDQPYLAIGSVRKLIAAFEERPQSIVSLCFGNRRGNPAIFPKDLFEELLALSEDTGGGAVIRRHPERLIQIEADTARELEDIDTRERLD